MIFHIFDCSSSFCILLIEFLLTFSISYIKYQQIIFIIIVFRFGCDHGLKNNTRLTRFFNPMKKKSVR